jgi:hypothetical protein
VLEAEIVVPRLEDIHVSRERLAEVRELALERVGLRVRVAVGVGRCAGVRKCAYTTATSNTAAATAAGSYSATSGVRGRG